MLRRQRIQPPVGLEIVLGILPPALHARAHLGEILHLIGAVGAQLGARARAVDGHFEGGEVLLESTGPGARGGVGGEFEHEVLEGVVRVVLAVELVHDGVVPALAAARVVDLRPALEEGVAALPEAAEGVGAVDDLGGVESRTVASGEGFEGVG